MKSIIKLQLQRSIIVAIIFLITGWFLAVDNPTFLKLPEETFRDWVMRTSAPTKKHPPERAVVVDINEDSILEVGAWPWRRDVVADLIETLVADYKAKAVAVDIVFPEPADQLGDEKLAALAQFAPVVLSQVFDYSIRSNQLKVGQLAGHQQLTGFKGKVNASGHIANHAALAGTPHVGNVGFQPDADGNLRRATHIVNYGGQAYPSLALATALLADGLKPDTRLLSLSTRIPFNKPLAEYTVVPAHRVLAHSVDPQFLQNKVVFIGSSSLGIGDRVATPLNPQTSGIFAHVAMYEGLLNGYPGQLQETRLGTLLGFVWLTGICVLAVTRFNKQAASLNIVTVVVAGLIWLGIAGWLAANLVEASLGAPFVALLGLLLLLVPYDWQTTQARSKLLMKTLNHHISPALARELIDSGEPNPLAPREAEITVLVVDVENYTSKIDNLEPARVATITRDILNIVGQAVITNRGTMDKFTGDGGIAFWGAPLPMPDHADLALQAALNMLERINDYNARQENKGMPPLRVRIGIDSGTVIVGDFGWSERAIYTALGICVGRAARFEQMGKTYAEDIIVGPNTVELSRNYRFEHIDRATLRGLKQPVDIFRVKVPRRE